MSAPDAPPPLPAWAVVAARCQVLVARPAYREHVHRATVAARVDRAAQAQARERRAR